ncbi:MAG: hypothetical protein SVK08_01090 [Halobacteriota archaeon]|nr:hypothetical protein [Halobacteriota archaeon]
MERGKKFEKSIQNDLTKASSGDVYCNVRVSHMYEFDAIVAEYPVLTFIEIKAYRSDMSPSRARVAARKLRRNCVDVTTNEEKWRVSWIPYSKSTVENEKLTHKERLFKKLEIDITEGWKYRMMLIVPDISYDIVLKSLSGDFMDKSRHTKYAKNLFDVEGIFLTVIPRKRIKDVF